MTNGDSHLTNQQWRTLEAESTTLLKLQISNHTQETENWNGKRLWLNIGFQEMMSEMAVPMGQVLEQNLAE
jgi:hypothetical protein